MSMTMGRNVLLQTASVLVLTASASFAKEDSARMPQQATTFNEAIVPSAHGGGVGTVYAQADDTVVDDETVPDYEEGEVGAREEQPDPDGDAQMEGDAAAGGDVVVDDESVGDFEEGRVGARESDPDAEMTDALRAWKLADFQDATIMSETGEAVGTVEKLAFDDGDDVYLVVSLSDTLDPISEGRRAIPLDNIDYDAASGSLKLDATTVGTIEAMADYDTVASGYTDVSTDAKLQSLMEVDHNEN